MRRQIAAMFVLILATAALQAHVVVQPRESQHNPAEGVLQWKAHQTFADASMRHWVGERGTKEPASTTTGVPKGQGAASSPADPTHKH